MKRAVLYLRLSSTVEDSTSIARQEADLRALADREVWDVAAVLVDDGVSGTKNRENADEALRMLREREVDVLAVWKLDRWSRQGVRAVGDLVEVLDATPGATFVALQDGLRSDQTSWRLVAVVLSEVARSEAENTSTRARSAIAYRKTVTHRYTGGGTVPYGYRSEPAPEGEGRVLVVHPAEAAIVREIAERVLSGVDSLTSIANDLTARGVPTSKSAYRRASYRGTPDETADRGRWTVSTIKALMLAPTILGRTSLGADVVRDADGLPVTAWPPLVDLATAERLRARLAPDASRGPRRRQARLLSGVAFCSECGSRLYVTTSNGSKGSKGSNVYKCSQSWQTGQSTHSVSINAEHLDTYVSDRWLAIVGDAPEVDEIAHVTDPGTTAALADVEEALREATAAMMDDAADPEALVRRIAALKARRSDLRAKPSTTTIELRPTGRTLAEAWHAADSDADRRATLLRALDHVAVAPGVKGRRGVDPERITFFWIS